MRIGLCHRGRPGRLQSRHGPSRLLRRPLHALRRRPGARDLPPRRAAGALRRGPAAVHAARPARERAAARGRGHRHRAGRRGGRRLERRRRAVAGDQLQPGPRPPAGLHGRAGRRRPGRDARRDGRPRRRPAEDQPADPGRARDRPLGAGRRLRDAVLDRAELRRSSSAATASATPSSAGARARSRTSRPCRRTPASATRSTSSSSPAWSRSATARRIPDTVVGTDSHTTMVNGLGVLGWGVGGIEAEAAMLGEAISMLVPQVVGFRLHGALPEGATATDLVLTVTQILRQTGVVGKFVEYFGHGLAGLPLADRATIGNMSPEYGATCGFFPVDDETLRYLRLTGRSDDQVALVEAYCKENGLWHDPEEQPTYSQVVELDLSTVEPSIAGPRRPQDRIPLREARNAFSAALPSFGVDGGQRRGRRGERGVDGRERRAGADGDDRAHRGRADDRRRDGRDRPRRRRDRRDHLVHEHLQPGRDDRRRAAREEGRRARPRAQAVGEDEPRARLEGRDRVLREGRPDARTSRRSGSTPSATAARPASGTPARCPRRSRRRSPPATSSPAPCSPATATSRPASIPR